MRLGWMGGLQHYNDLKVVKDALPELLKRNPHLKYVSPSMMPDFWEQLAMDNKDRFVRLHYAPIQTWPEHLADAGLDVALAPLNSSYFNKSKSNLKFLEHSALGIPGVYSDIEPYREVQDGVTGFVAHNADEWVEKTEALINDKELRQKMGKAAKEYVFANYSIADKAQDWAAAYEEVYARGKGPAKRLAEQSARMLQKRRSAR